MPLATNLMAVGFAGPQAERLGFGDQNAFDGKGTSQAGATRIPRWTTNVALGTEAGNTAFILPDETEYFMQYFLLNTTAEAALVYPPLGASFDALAVNAPIVISEDDARIFWRVEDGRWCSSKTGASVSVSGSGAPDNIPVFGADSDTIADSGVPIETVTGALQKDENLSDLSDVLTARGNLGLGSAATANTGDFATAAQGETADNSAQKGQNLTDLTDKAQARLNLKVPVYVADRTALKVLDTTKDVLTYLKEDGREGIFEWTAGDFSTQITADTQEGIYIKADAIASNSGAWVRVYDDALDIRWFGAVLDGTDNGNTTAFQAMAAMPFGDIEIELPAGDICLSDVVTFTNKNVSIGAAGVSTTRIRFLNTSSKIRFLDTSTGSVAKKLAVSDLTLLKDYVASSLDGSVGIEAQWSYTGIIASWEHALFENITAQANGSARYWDTAIKLIDSGVVRAINCRFDNAGAQASGSRAFFDLVRLNATNTCSFHFDTCFSFGTTAFIRITHASAPAGTVEGIYLTDCETPGCRYGIYDDNEGTGDTTRTINDVKWVAGHANISRALMLFGYVTNLFIVAGNFTFGNLMDSAPALEAAVVIRTYAESISIEGGRFLRGSGAATGKPVALLPTLSSVKSVRIIGPSLGGWGAVVDQTGTPTRDRNRILVLGTVHENIPLSSTTSGYEVNAPQIVAQSAVAVPLTGTATETTLVTIPIIGGAIGPNGRLRITTTWSFTNNVNSKTFRIKLGGTQIWSRTESANVSARHSTEMANRNSLTSQVTNSGSTGGGWGPVGSAVVTTVVDTSASQNLTITAQLANSADSVTLESYLVEQIYGE